MQVCRDDRNNAAFVYFLRVSFNLSTINNEKYPQGINCNEFLETRTINIKTTTQSRLGSDRIVWRIFLSKTNPPVIS